MTHVIERSDQVSRGDVVEAIRAFVRAEEAAEAAEYDKDSDFDFDEWWESEEASRHRGTIRRYAEQLGDVPLEAMQRAFDGLVGEPAAFRVSREARSVARTIVSYAWDGVGPWRD